MVAYQSKKYRIALFCYIFHSFAIDGLAVLGSRVAAHSGLGVLGALQIKGFLLDCVGPCLLYALARIAYLRLPDLSGKCVFEQLLDQVKA